mmetsp:Transcript_7002/g.17200  ORF Transcript_7002/g.17200 Transcript_7002/m.17200 type:complete len:455 (+) Transcript_7002:3-1367(+)
MKERQAKAYYREGSALSALDRHSEALEAYKKGLRATPLEPGLCKALRLCSRHMKVDWMARYLASLIGDAEAPNRFSSRDGKLLKRPIDRHKLPAPALQRKSRELLLGREEEFRGYVCDAWCRGKDPGRCLLSVVRAYAYLSKANSGQEGDEGAVEQSLKDANAAVAFAPSVKARRVSGPPLPPLAARALAARSAVLEHLGDYVGAALDIADALCPPLPPPPQAKEEEESGTREEYRLALERLRAKLSEEQRGALDAGGREGLAQWREDARERSLPEFMRKRPKYYYYYEWMKKRIAEQFPAGLPQPVVDKLLTTDADELDLLLQYPEAIRGQVDEYLSVLQGEGGERALETYETPRLSWDEVRALKHQDEEEASALAVKGGATNHALVAGGGRGELTAAEREGKPVKPSLAPDAARDRHALLEDRRAISRLTLASGSTLGGAGGGAGGDLDGVD